MHLFLGEFSDASAISGENIALLFYTARQLANPASNHSMETVGIS